MPSYCYAADALATKLITLYPNNMAKGVPSHQAVVLLMSASTGTPLAVSNMLFRIMIIVYNTCRSIQCNSCLKFDQL